MTRVPVANVDEAAAAIVVTKLPLLLFIVNAPNVDAFIN
jgi:hypothetical protein